jgi:hypothetical protein
MPFGAKSLKTLAQNHRSKVVRAAFPHMAAVGPNFATEFVFFRAVC